MALSAEKTCHMDQKAKIGEMILAVADGRIDDADSLFESVMHEKSVERIRSVLDSREGN